MQNPASPAPSAGGGQAGGAAPAAAAPVTAAPSAGVDINTVRIRLDQLRTELRMAKNQQRSILEDMQGAPSVAQAGLTKQLTVVQEQVVDLQKQIGTTEAQISSAVSNGQTTVAPADYNYPVRTIEHGFDSGAMVGIVFFVVVLGPLAFALARRILRRPVAPMPPAAWLEAPGRLERLEQAVDSVAIEVERISESQRFLTRVLGERQPVADPHRIAT